VGSVYVKTRIANAFPNTGQIIKDPRVTERKKLKPCPGS
jgi:hypothetical protein